MNDQELAVKLECDHFESDDRRGFEVIGAILKAQGAVIRELGDARHLGTYLRTLLVASLLFSAAYGAILGLFHPGWQTLFASAKIAIVVVGTALLCTPTFYVFNSILGSRLSFAQSASIVLLMVASAGLILLAFAPISWLFTMTTGGAVFLRLFHLVVFGIAIVFGAHVLGVARRYLLYLKPERPAIHTAFLRVWFGIVLIVAFQMAFYLRPILTPGPFHTGDRGIFLEGLKYFVGL